MGALEISDMFFYVFTSHLFGSSWKDRQDNYEWMKQEPDTSLGVNAHFPVFCIMVIIKACMQYVEISPPFREA